VSVRAHTHKKGRHERVMKPTLVISFEEDGDQREGLNEDGQLLRREPLPEVTKHLVDGLCCVLWSIGVVVLLLIYFSSPARGDRPYLSILNPFMDLTHGAYARGAMGIVVDPLW
jgi:hypothetical protein